MDSQCIGILLIILFSEGVKFSKGDGSIDDSITERILLEKLLKDYDVNARPVWDIEAPVNVSLSVALGQILDLDDRRQVLSAAMSKRMFWTDVRMQWNSSEYGGLDVIRMNVDRLWRPDVILYNDVSSDEHNVDYPIVVYNNGTVIWQAPIIYSSTCLLDVRYFPWDSQMCNLTFGSWTYDVSKLNLISRQGSEAPLDNFVENGEWTLEGIPVTRIVNKYVCCPEAFVTLDFGIKIKRKPLYYIVNLILPCVFISATGIMVFYLPPDSGEKVSLAVTVLLASTVFLLMVADIIPRSDAIPLIGQFFLSMILILSACTILTVIVLNLHHRGAHSIPVPRWLRVVILSWMATAVGLKGVVANNLASTQKRNGPSTNGCSVHFGSVIDWTEPIETQNNSGSGDTSESTTQHLLAQILQTLRGFGQRREAREQADAVKGEWMLIALVLDRFFLIVFSVGFVAVCIGVVVSHP